MNNLISVIIPNYNGKDLLEKNLPKVIFFAKKLKNKKAEIIVVDDHSKDDSVHFLQNNYQKDIKLIRHSKNRGFSSAVNTGVRAASGDLLFLINTDAYPKENFDISVFDNFNKKNVFAVSLNEENEFGPAGAKFEDGFVNLLNRKKTGKVEESFFVSGGSGIFRKNIWKELGGLDEKLFSPYYWEDLDICYRAMKRGYINLWDCKAKIVHNHQSTISKLNQNKVNLIRERNQLLFIWKNIQSANFIKRHIKGLLLRTFYHPGYLKVILMAGFKIFTVVTLRKKENKESVVSDEAVFSRFS